MIKIEIWYISIRYGKMKIQKVRRQYWTNIIRYSVWSVCGNFRTEWFRKVYIGKAFKCTVASE